MNKEFDDIYAEFTAISIHGTFKNQPQIEELPFAATKDSRKWLEQVCRIYKQKFGDEIEFHFRSAKGKVSSDNIKFHRLSTPKICFFKRKENFLRKSN